MIPIKQPSQVMSGPGFSIKNKTKQAGFAVPHSSLTITITHLGFSHRSECGNNLFIYSV